MIYDTNNTNKVRFPGSIGARPSLQPTERGNGVYESSRLPYYQHSQQLRHNLARVASHADVAGRDPAYADVISRTLDDDPTNKVAIQAAQELISGAHRMSGPVQPGSAGWQHYTTEHHFSETSAPPQTPSTPHPTSSANGFGHHTPAA